MGLPSGIAVHARHRDGPDRGYDRGQAPAQCAGRRARRTTGARRLLALGLILALAAPAAADTLRIATYNVGLTRRGPGLLLADLSTGRAPDAQAAAQAIRAADPDVLLLTGIDWDAGLATLDAFDRLIGDGAPAYAHRFALRPNTGLMTGYDLDGDGRRGGPGDAQGYGLYAGQGGMAVLSRLPIDLAAARDFSDLLWRDLPGADLPRHPDGNPFPSEEAQAVQRLATTAFWDVPVMLPGGGTLNLLCWYASPPVFDGPEDRNGRRSADELRFWTLYLDGAFGLPPEAFVLLGDANLDPAGGDGNRAAIAALLADPRLTDPHPGKPTAYWPDPPGPLRVDYALPAAVLTVTGAGVVDPAPGEPLHKALSGKDAPAHRLVWLDLALE